MGEKFPPQPWDPYRDFHEKDARSDEERMEEYAQTGNPVHLTPELIAKMGLRVADDGTLKSAHESDDEIDDKILAEHGIDNAALRRTNDPDVVVSAFLPLATASIAEGHEQKLADARELAKKELSRYIFENPGPMVQALFAKLDPNSLNSLEVIRYLEDELNLTKKVFVDKEANFWEKDHISVQSRKILEAFEDASGIWWKRLHEKPEGLYFVHQAMTTFMFRIFGHSDIKDDPDMYVPFEISKGTYAAFTSDKNRLYIGTPEQSEHVRALFSQGWTPDYIKKGHDAATYEYEYFAEELPEMCDEIIDAGTPITDLYANEFQKNPELLKDYITLLDSRVRALIEHDLDIRLRDLSIREQFSLLDHAKHVDVKDFERLAEFSKLFGSSGLRTFLVTARDEDLRNKLFKFAESVPEEQTAKVFAAYGRLVDSIDNVGEYLRDAFGSESAEAAQVIVERQLDRARNLLSLAYDRKESPEQLLGLVENANAENTLFLDAYKAIKTENPGLRLEDVPAVQSRIIPGHELLANQALQETIEKLYAKNWPPETAQLLVSRFRESLGESNAKFYLLSHQINAKDVPIAFMLTTEIGDNRIYVSALNIDQEFAGARPGMVLLHKMVEMIKTGTIIEAVTPLHIARAYTFAGHGVVDGIVHDTDGSVDFHVVLDERLNTSLKSRDRSHYRVSRLVGMASEHFDPAQTIQVLRAAREEDLSTIIEKPLEAGFVVTQLLPSEGATLAVIEKVGESQQQAAAA